MYDDMCGLAALIPKDVLNEKLSQYYCEIEPKFLCFEHYYAPVAEHIPKSFVILDLGCYMAAQSYFFENHKKYVGVDLYDINGGYKGYIAPKRFATNNTEHYILDIIDFIKRYKELYAKQDVYAICSAVPDVNARKAVYDSFDNCLVVYPGLAPKAKGIFKTQIISAIRSFEEKHYEN